MLADRRKGLPSDQSKSKSSIAGPKNLAMATVPKARPTIPRHGPASIRAYEMRPVRSESLFQRVGPFGRGASLMADLL